MRRLFFIALCSLVLAVAPVVLCTARAAQIETLPTISRGYVSDFTNRLSGMDDVERLLQSHHADTGEEVVIVFLPSLPPGMAIDEAAQRLADQWEVGSATEDTGVLVLIVDDLQQVHATVGFGLQDALPDDVLRSLLAKTVAPAFVNGVHESGVRALAQALVMTLEVRDDRFVNGTDSSLPGIIVVGVSVLLCIGGIFVVLRKVRGVGSQGRRSQFSRDMKRRVVRDM